MPTRADLFIRRLDSLLSAAGYETDKQLCEVAGLSPNQLSLLRRRAGTMTSRIPGSSDTHARLAAALGVTVAELRGDAPVATDTRRARALQAARLVGLSAEAIQQVAEMPDDGRSELAWFRLVEAMGAAR